MFRPDAISLTYIPNSYSQTTISSGRCRAVAELKVNDLERRTAPKQDPLCGFTEGMVVIIFDSTGHFDTFTITNVQDAAAHLQHRGQDLNYSYESGASITQIVSNTFYLDSATNQLMRYNGGATDTPIVDNVVDMQVELLRRSESAEGAQATARRSELPVRRGRELPKLPVLPLTDGSLAALTPRDADRPGVLCGAGDNQYDAGPAARAQGPCDPARPGRVGGAARNGPDALEESRQVAGRREDSFPTTPSRSK